MPLTSIPGSSMLDARPWNQDHDWRCGQRVGASHTTETRFGGGGLGTSHIIIAGLRERGGKTNHQTGAPETFIEANLLEVQSCELNSQFWWTTASGIYIRF